MATGHIGATFSGAHSATKIVTIVPGTCRRLFPGDVVQVNGAGGTFVVQSANSDRILLSSGVTANDGDRLIVQETF